VRAFANIEELVAVAIEVERVLGELGETPLKPLKRRGMRVPKIISWKSRSLC
jgi:hypothetical protein